MKKFAILSLTFVFILGSFFGCKKPTESVEPPHVETEELYDPMHGVDLGSPVREIVKDGKTDYKIVIADDAAVSERYAANELSSYIYKATGVQIPLAADSETTFSQTGKYISVGNTELLKDSGISFDYSALNDEGFFLKTVGNSLFMNGANQRGTLYSVYDFLEKFLGIRFLTEDATHIPETDSLSIHDLDVVEVPAFRYRDFQGSAIINNGTFAAKVRMSDVWASSNSVYGGGYIDLNYQANDHSIFDLLPPSVYMEEHPDWYFKSSSAHAPVGGASQVCLTNEEMTEEAIKNLKQWILARPDAKYFMIGQADMNPFCDCAHCTESYERNGGKSGTMIVFLNKLARAVNQWMKEEGMERDIIIQTFAYQDTLAAPVRYDGDKILPYNDDVIPEDNVMIKVAIDKACFFHPLTDEDCPQNALPRRSIKEWHALSDNLYVWEYTTNFSSFITYFANTGVLKENIKFYKANGVTNVLTQNSNQSKEHYQGQLKCYVISKLLWNPNRNVQALIDEFNTLYYGEEIKPYIDEVTRLFEMHYKAKDFYGIINAEGAFFRAENIPQTLLTQTISLFEEAKKVNRTGGGSDEEKDIIEKRISAYMITPQFMLLSNWDEYNRFDSTGKIKLAKEFFANTDSIGMTHYKENYVETIETLKLKYLG